MKRFVIPSWIGSGRPSEKSAPKANLVEVLFLILASGYQKIEKRCCEKASGLDSKLSRSQRLLLYGLLLSALAWKAIQPLLGSNSIPGNWVSFNTMTIPIMGPKTDLILAPDTLIQSISLQNKANEKFRKPDAYEKEGDFLPLVTPVGHSRFNGTQLDVFSCSGQTNPILGPIKQ